MGVQFYLVAITLINPIDCLVNIGNCFLHMVKKRKKKALKSVYRYDLLPKRCTTTMHPEISAQRFLHQRENFEIAAQLRQA